MKIFTTFIIITFLFLCASVDAQKLIEQYNKVKLYSIENTNGKELALTLNQNYPNPFDVKTTIEFTIPLTGRTTLTIYNILGKEVVGLVSKELTAGSYKVEWDTKGLPEGTYFYRLQSGDTVKSRILHKLN